MTKLNTNEQLVLRFLSKEVEYYSGSPGFCSFDMITNGIRNVYLTRKEVRRACRSLKRKGLTEFSTGLWNDYGPAGAGYAATRAGLTRASSLPEVEPRELAAVS